MFSHKYNKRPPEIYNLDKTTKLNSTYMSKDQPRWTTGLGTKLSSPGARRIGLATDGVARVNVPRHTTCTLIRASQPRLPFYCDVAPPHLAITCRPRRDSSSLSFTKNSICRAFLRKHKIRFSSPQSWSTVESIRKTSTKEARVSRSSRCIYERAPSASPPNREPSFARENKVRGETRRKNVECRGRKAGQCVARGCELPRCASKNTISFCTGSGSNQWHTRDSSMKKKKKTRQTKRPKIYRFTLLARWMTRAPRRGESEASGRRTTVRTRRLKAPEKE